MLPIIMRNRLLLILYMIAQMHLVGAQNNKSLFNDLRQAKSDTTRIRIFNQLAEYYYKTYRYDSCEIYATRAMSIADKLLKNQTVSSDDAYSLVCRKLRTEALTNFGSSLIYKNASAAIDMLKKTARLWTALGDIRGMAFTYCKLGEIYTNQGEYEKTIESFKTSIRYYTQIDDKVNLITTYYELSLGQRYMANYGDALESNLKALDLAKEIRDTSMIIQALLSNGFIYMFVEEYTSALESQHQALQFATQVKDSSLIATAYSDLGNTHLRQGKKSEALRDFKIALNIRELIKDDQYLSSLYLYISEILIGQEKYQEALVSQFKALRIAGQQQDSRYILDAYNEIAFTYDTLAENKKALIYYDSLFKKSMQYSNPYYQSVALQGMANIYYETGQTQKSINKLQEALKYTKKEDYKNFTKIYKNLSLAYEKENDYKNAFYSAIKFKQWSDSLEISVKKLKMTSLTNHLDFQNKRALQKASQDKQLTIQQNEIKRQKLVKNFSLVGLLVVVLLAVNYYRRFSEKRKLNIQLESTLSNLKSTQKQLIQSEKMASLGELTAGIAHEIQNPLNFVNNFSEVSNELIDEMNQELDRGDIEEAKAISVDIKLNLEKIYQHGKRAGAIVKGMLQHSRTGAGQKELTDINALCDEYLRLSYHGLRAKDKSFNAKFDTNFDPTIPKVNIVAQDISRVILNMINNAFYAVFAKASALEKDASGDPITAPAGYNPTVWISTKKEGNSVIISIKDNGNGIPDKIKEKIFQPFFTTKPVGSGTGLGLSLSYDIMKAHEGEIKVNTIVGEGTEMLIRIPV